MIRVHHLVRRSQRVCADVSRPRSRCRSRLPGRPRAGRSAARTSGRDVRPRRRRPRAVDLLRRPLGRRIPHGCTVDRADRGRRRWGAGRRQRGDRRGRPRSRRPPRSWRSVARRWRAPVPGWPTCCPATTSVPPADCCRRCAGATRLHWTLTGWPARRWSRWPRTPPTRTWLRCCGLRSAACPRCWSIEGPTLSTR